MSQRGEKGAAQSKSEKGEKRESSAIADGLRPESLPEITHNGWKEWDDTMLKLKKYMKINFQDLVVVEMEKGSRGKVGLVTGVYARS